MRAKLTRVCLSIDGEGKQGEAEAIRDEVTDALREKYGAPISSRLDHSVSGRPGIVMRWKADRTVVNLHALVMSQHLWLTIIYTVEDNQESKKL